MADTLRALTPAAARRLRAQIEQERELRARGIEPSSHFPDGEWDATTQWARRSLKRRGLLRPEVPVTYPF